MKPLLFIAIVSSVMGVQAQESSSAPASSLLTTQKKDNRPLFDAYGVVPQSLSGGGFGMGIFSPAINAVKLGTGTEFRVGGDFYVTGTGHKTINDVPLLAPQTGAAKCRLSETMIGFNAVARVSFPWSAHISPYVDGFAGLRAFSTDISVTPNEYQPGYEKSTSDNLDNACSFNYGAAGGLLITLGKNVKLNTAVVFTHADNPGKISNIQSASLEGTRMAMDQKTINNNIVYYKVGLTFKINPSKPRTNCCHCCESRTTASVWVPFRSSGRASAPNRIGFGGIKR